MTTQNDGRTADDEGAAGGARAAADGARAAADGARAAADGAKAARVTLADVAARAGVSLPTASKVMNGRAAVSEQTREAVAEAAAELGYRPRRRRPPERRRTIAVHLEAVDSAYVMDVFAGVTRAARKAGADLLVTDAEPEADKGLSRAWMTDMAARGADGVIAVVTRIGAEHGRWSRSLGLPLIAIDPVLDGPESTGVPGVLTVTATNWEGGAAAVRHLLDLGHRRIGILAGPEHSVPGQQRLAGYLSALGQAGLPADPELIRHGDFDGESGAEGAGALLDLADPPTAIFATSDNLALGALRAARSRDVAVPERLSVIGFDDTMVTRWTTPQLTAVSQPLASMGQVAVERLLALAEDPSLFSHPFKLETRLIERESTAAPR